ncbi:DUF418 domain-containing protein [Salipaludibacillus sp. HK11]|uniref:DUF418 domain-containing protein n=1 Tax=Salipaludibacillus sp. HK11 TaxID=3394320 RepID=UPI0039FDDDD3
MNKNLQPLKVNERLLELDVLRGIALFGILVVNMKYFATPVLYLEMLGLNWWDDSLNLTFKLLVQLVFEFKFISMFSFLFGVGFALFLSRAEKKGISGFPLMKRRLLFLLVVGLVHLFFIWYGDILTIYALLGFLLLFFLKKKLKLIIRWAFCFIIFPVVLYSLTIVFDLDNTSQIYNIEGIMERAVYAYTEGTMFDIFVQRVVDIAAIYHGHIFIIPTVFGMFLLGVYAWKSGIISNAKQQTHRIKQVRNRSLLIGLPFVVVSSLAGIYDGSMSSQYFIIQNLGNSISGPAIAIFYMSSIFLLLQKDYWRRMLAFLQPIGRMAFTNYLFQSVICTMIFYSYGLGQFGNVGYARGFLLAMIIFFFQVIFSYYYLKSFKMGPVEFLWRKYTYKK